MALRTCLDATLGLELDPTDQKELKALKSDIIQAEAQFTLHNTAGDEELDPDWTMETGKRKARALEEELMAEANRRAKASLLATETLVLDAKAKVTLTFSNVVRKLAAECIY